MSQRTRRSNHRSTDSTVCRTKSSSSGSGLPDGVEHAGIDVESSDLRATLLPVGGAVLNDATMASSAIHGGVPPSNAAVAGSKLDASATIPLGGNSPPMARRGPLHQSLNRRATIQHGSDRSAGASTGFSRGGRGTFTSASGASAWKLKYQDFMPNSTGDHHHNESFQTLVDKANDWLRKNTELQVRTCETVTWMSHDQKTLDSTSLSGGEQMVLSKRVSEDALTYYVRGLRLWVVPQIVNKPQFLCFSDFAPSTSSDHIQSLVTKVNSSIDHSQLTGQVLTVETISVPISSGGDIDCGVTRWKESANVDCPYAFALRVFHNKEVNGRIYGTERAHIGVKDIVPQPTLNSYEGFEDLIDRMNYWLKEQSDMYITNLQSVMVQKQNGPHSETGSACFYSQPGINRPHPVDFFRILRIGYLKPVGDLLVELPVKYPVSYETFTPELVKLKELVQKERIEKMKETFSKVSTFLQMLGGDIICAETVINPMQLYPQESAQNLPPVDEIKFLLTIRLYYTGKISHVGREGSVRSAKRPSVGSCRGGISGHGIGGGLTSRSSPRNSENSEHPGPIFLRHVVSRRFEYRWMILASTAITCMTIIVIVSVVYSNL